MAQSQIRIPTIEELKAAQVSRTPGFDPSALTNAYITGTTLQDTVAQRALAQRQAEEDLKKEIMAAKEMAAQKKRAQEYRENPVLSQASKLLPEESAKQQLQQMFQEKQAPQRADNLKQILQVGDRTVGITYGGEMKDIPLGGRAQPLVAPKLPAASTEKLAELGQVADKLHRAKALFEESKLPDGSSPLVGIMDNAMGRTAEFVGSPDAKTTEFRTLVTNNINQQIKAITGAQLSEPEAQRIMKALPSLNLGDAAFEQRLKDAITITEDVIKQKQAAYSSFSGVPNVLPERKMEQPTGNAGMWDQTKESRYQELMRKKQQGTLR
jgi:hypothetical protein